MAKQVSELSIFVASPSDVAEERDLLEDVVKELNLQWSRGVKGVRLELVRWETHSYPGVSSDPQAVINDQIGDDYDIFLGILWKRFGTATPRADSGTEEEFDRAYERHNKDPNKLRIMIYFKTGDVNLAEIDVEQLGSVRDFQSRLGPKGTLFREFSSPKDFSSLVRMHLSHCVDDWGKKWGSGAVAARPEATLQPCVSEDSDDEGFLDLIEAVMLSFAQLQEQAERIAESTETLGRRIAERTEEMNKALAIADQSNLKLVKRICNSAADNLESYATIMDVEVPLFAAKFTEGIESYAKAAAMLPDFSSEDKEAAQQLDDAIEIAAGLRKSMNGAVQSLAEFRQAIATHPRMTTKYNRAKRHTLKILDRFLAEMKSGSDRLTECQKLLGAMRAELPLPSTEQEDSGDA